MPPELVQRDLARARANSRIMLLGCCFSGRAVAAMGGGSHTALAGQLDLTGTCILNSTTSIAPFARTARGPPHRLHLGFARRARAGETADPRRDPPLVGEEYVLANPRRKPLQRAGLVLLWLAILSAPVTWLVNADFLFAHIVPMLIMIGQTGRYDFALTVNGSGLTMGGSDFRRLGYINFCDLSGIGASEFSLDEAIVGVAGRTVFRSDRELIEQDHRLASAPR